MSRQRKRQFRFATFVILPAILVLAAFLPAFLIVDDKAGALSASEWEYVRTALNSYVTTQYQADSVDGESGFTIESAALKTRIDSDGDGNYLDEGDDVANAPVLVDVLNGGQGGVVQSTAVIGTWNTTSLQSGTVNQVASWVNKHEAAGFTTDVVVYCLTGHTEAVAAGGYGAVSYAGGLGGSTPPKVLGLKWGRYGWNTGTKTYTKTNDLAAPDATGTFADDSNAAACSGVTPVSELVRCTAEWALNATTGGNVGNGFAADATTGYTGYQVIDIRPGDVGASSVAESDVTYQVPINTIFNSGLNALNPGGSKVLIANRTQHTAGMIAVGTEMLGYDSTFSNWGLREYNNTIGEAYPGGAGYGLIAFAPDTTAPSISGGLGYSNKTATSIDLSRTMSEPATSKIHLSDAAGVAPDVDVNSTVLQTAKTVSVTGLVEGVHYQGTLTAYDGMGNASADQAVDFWTDVTAPSITSVLPSGTIYSGSTTITVNYSDSESGIDTANVSVTVDGSPVSCGTVDQTHASCDVSGLAYGPHTIGGSVPDNSSSAATINGSFTVGDNVAPIVTYTGPTGTINNTSPTITGTTTDPQPSSGLNSAVSAILSLDGGTNFLYSCTISGSAVSCPVTGLIGDPATTYDAQIRVTDNMSNAGTSAVTQFTVDSAFVPVEINYYWTWYDDLYGDNWVLMANTDAVDDATYTLKVGSTDMDLTGYNNGVVAPGTMITPKFNGVIGGPVKAVSTTGADGILSQRILWPKGGDSLEEVVASTVADLSDHFWWTWYDEASPGYQNWILVGNPSPSATVNYEIKIAGNVVESGSLLPGEEKTPHFPGQMGGPVELTTTGGNVMASQRVLSNNGMDFTEVPGILHSELNSAYLWTWYDEASAGAQDWVLVANPSNSATVNYEIKVNGELKAQGELLPNEVETPHFPGVNGGPVEVSSTGGDVIASQRVVWGPSFDELPGLGMLSSDYLWTWYDQSVPGVSNWVLVANTSASATVNYEIKVAGNLMASGQLLPGASVTPQFNGLVGGPVQVTSTGGPVMASQRVIWKGYFNEVLGS